MECVGGVDGWKVSVGCWCSGESCASRASTKGGVGVRWPLSRGSGISEVTRDGCCWSTTRSEVLLCGMMLTDVASLISMGVSENCENGVVEAYACLASPYSSVRMLEKLTRPCSSERRLHSWLLRPNSSVDRRSKDGRMGYFGDEEARSRIGFRSSDLGGDSCASGGEFSCRGDDTRICSTTRGVSFDKGAPISSPISSSISLLATNILTLSNIFNGGLTSSAGPPAPKNPSLSASTSSAGIPGSLLFISTCLASPTFDRSLLLSDLGEAVEGTGDSGVWNETLPARRGLVGGENARGAEDGADLRIVSGAETMRLCSA